MNRITIGLAAGVLLALTSLPVSAATRNWLGGSATWDDTTTANWSGGAVPVNGDTANITSNTAANLSVGYTATGLSALGTLTVSNPGSGTNTLYLDGSDSLTVTNLNVNARGALNLSGGTLAIPAGGIAYVNGGALAQSGGLLAVNSSGNGPIFYGGGTGSMSGGAANTRSITVGGISGRATFTLDAGTINDYWVTYIKEGGTFNQNGGCFTQMVNYMYLNAGSAGGESNSVFNMRGGTNCPKYLLMGGAGVMTFNQSGGVVTNVTGGIEMRDTGPMTYNLSGGFAYIPSLVSVGSYANSRAAFNHTGGTLSCNQLLIGMATGNYDCTYTLNGGTLNINVPNNAQAKVYPHGIFQGYGTVTMINYQFQNDGRVIADGCGNNTNLDLSTAGTILNATDNTTNHGWFAVNKGKLLLPNVAIAAGASTQNWGEAAADTTIDLVNSARLAFSGATAGNLTGNLLASDRTDVPSGLRKPVGIWSFGGVTCTAATVTFRYDDAAAAALRVAESDLRVWRYSGTTWMNVTDTRDDAAKTIASLPVGSLGTPTFFAVAPSPFPGTVFAVR